MPAIVSQRVERITAEDDINKPIYCIANVQFTQVLSYASKLSKYTSAPPNFDQMKRDGNMDFEKPYPDEEKMRRSLLYWQNAPQQRMEDKCKL